VRAEASTFQRDEIANRAGFTSCHNDRSQTSFTLWMDIISTYRFVIDMASLKAGS